MILDFDKRITHFIQEAMAEDTQGVDITSEVLISPMQQGVAVLFIKEDGIIAGLGLAKKIFNSLDESLQIEQCMNDGEHIKVGDKPFHVFGNIRSILKAERVVLNSLQRMSGIATLVNALKQKIAHTQTQILDTRKTSPGARVIEKWAVTIGGGKNHRFGLFDEILVKDNHIDACGGIHNVIKKLETYAHNNPNISIIVECRNETEWNAANHSAAVNRILLDNLSPEQLGVALKQIRKPTEASGNINTENIVQYAETGVDYVSLGFITHSYRSLDMSLKLQMN